VELQRMVAVDKIEENKFKETEITNLAFAFVELKGKYGYK
jgi:hypothetical protein